MRSVPARFCLFLLVLGLPAVSLCAESAPPEVRTQFDVPVEMRDGVKLAADVYLPKQEGKYPVVLVRTPYGKQGAVHEGVYFASHGYVLVAEDTRGRFESDGRWYAFAHEADDGYDSIEWAARQPWSNGRVVTAGGSYMAIDQWLAATRLSPHLAAMLILVSPSDLYANTIHNGGAFQYGTALTWSVGTGRHTNLNDQFKLIAWPEIFRRLPVQEAAQAAGYQPRFYRDWIAHAARDAYWKALGWDDVYSKLSVPVLNFGGWFDIFQEGTIENFLKMTRQAPDAVRGAQRLIVGPWAHMAWGPKVGDVDFGPQSKVDVDAKELRWLDHYVKGVANGAEKDPPIETFAMGINQWKSEDAWPPSDTRPVRLYFHSGGKANTADGDGVLSETPPGTEPPDHFDDDPADPVPTHGGGTCCSPQLIPWGALDQRPIEKRHDVLVYSTTAFETDFEVVGPLVVHLFASSSAPDTDWTAKLVDVNPSGFAMNLSDGILRARFRHSFQTPELLVPGRAYEFVVNAGNTHNVFRRGHRLRLEIAGSNFPRFSRNTHTGKVPETDASFTVAHETVYHDGARASYLLLHVRRGD